MTCLVGREMEGYEGRGRRRLGESHLQGEAEESGREARRAPLRPLDEPRRCAQRRRRLCLPLHVGGTLAAGHRLGERSEGGHDEEVRLARSEGGGGGGGGHGRGAAGVRSLAASGSWLQSAGRKAQG